MADPTPRENFEAMRKRSPEEFRAYLWDYYSKPALIVLIAIFLIGTFVYELATKKEIVFCGLMMDTYKLDDNEPFIDDFAEFTGIDQKKQGIHMINNLSMVSEDLIEQKEATELFIVRTAANEIDVITLCTIQFQMYERDLMIDLREVLSAEQLEAIGDHLYYIDLANLVPGSTDPTGFENPVPVGIDVVGCEKFEEYYLGANKDCIMGICSNTQHPDMAAKFVEFMFPIE